ncbi:MAG: type II toxin-antitoxin system Phd/YefM family antitoxin [Tissierellia bacterium]|nr:type II toxin-antitoxin system Phd/YefM family antitoxin [Tissierellia bacterium]
MKINTDSLVSITEANQNFSKVARLVDEKGSVLILKNNVPKYLIVEFKTAESYEIASDDDVDIISNKLLRKNLEAYKELAK